MRHEGGDGSHARKRVEKIVFLPLLAGSLFQQLYTTADAVIVGRFAGKEGLTTIDAIYSLLKLPVNFFVGLSTGATILVLQRQAGKGADQSCAYRCGFALVGGAVLSATGMAAAPICLRLMAVPVFGDEIMVIVASCPVPWILTSLLFIVYRWRKGEAMFCAPAFEKGKEKAA